MAVEITDGTDHVALNYSDTNEQRDFIQKGSFFLRRDGDDFLIMPFDSPTPLAKFSYAGSSPKYITVDASNPVHASADALETALLGFLFS